MQNYNIKTDETTGMRIIEYNVSSKQKKQINVFDYVILVLLFLLFSFFFLDILFFVIEAISYHLEGNTYGASWCLAWAVIGSPTLLIFGIPLFLKLRSILKYKKFLRIQKDMLTKDHCVPATVIKIDYIDHSYAKDEYWLVCDVMHAASQTIYRYTSEKVKEDLFLKFKEGDKIAVYLNLEDSQDYYVDLEQRINVSELSEFEINEIYKTEENEQDNNVVKDKTENYYFEETDDETGMRIINRKNALFEKSKTAVTIEWILIVVLSGIFLSVLGCIIMGVGVGISYHNAGLMEISTLIVIFCIYGLPAILLFGLPLFFMIKSKMTNPKRMKPNLKWICEDNRIWAVVKTIDFIDYKYAKDEFWLICDVEKAEEQVIYRYSSFRVKEDLFDKIKPGQEIAIYINPEKPNQYYVNIDEVK